MFTKKKATTQGGRGAAAALGGGGARACLLRPSLRADCPPYISDQPHELTD